MIEAAIAILGALAGPLSKLIEVGLADDYDAEAERKALLDFQRALFEERLKRRMKQPR